MARPSYKWSPAHLPNKIEKKTPLFLWLHYLGTLIPISSISEICELCGAEVRPSANLGSKSLPKKSQRNNGRAEPWCIGLVRPQANSIMKLETFFLTQQWHPCPTLVFTRIRLINILPLSHHQIIHLCPSSHPSIPISFASCYWSMFLVFSHPSNTATPTSLPQLGASSQIYSLNICGRNAQIQPKSDCWIWTLCNKC